MKPACLIAVPSALGLALLAPGCTTPAPPPAVTPRPAATVHFPGANRS